VEQRQRDRQLVWHKFLAPNNANNNVTFVGGGQMGANYRFGSFVASAEGDLGWFGNNNNSASVARRC
jgi:hypothetical protein